MYNDDEDGNSSVYGCILVTANYAHSTNSNMVSDSERGNNVVMVIV